MGEAARFIHTSCVVQQHMPFKSLSALREEITALGLRFKRLVDKVSYVEESASNIEFELIKLEEMLQRIISTYRPAFTCANSTSNIQQLQFHRDGSPIGSDGLPSRLMPQPSALYKELVEFFNLFLATEKRYKGLVYKISSLEDSASNIVRVLQGIQDRTKNLLIKDLPASNQPGAISVAPRKNNIPTHLRETLVRDAESGIISFSAKLLANGRGEFEIQGRKLTLSPRLSNLLIALSEDVGPRADDLVGWKTLEELAQLVLAPKHEPLPMDSAGQKKIHHRMRQSIYLLSMAFYLAGINPFLIQNNRALGYRFALRLASGGHHETANNQNSGQICSA